MKIVNERLLDEFRTPGNCEWCGKKCRRREPSHLRGKGQGAYRLDIRINLNALGSTIDKQCDCHIRHHAGNEPTYYDLLTIIAQREGVLQDDIEEAVEFLRNISRKDLATVQSRIAQLSAGAQKLAKEALVGHI